MPQISHTQSLYNSLNFIQLECLYLKNKTTKKPYFMGLEYLSRCFLMDTALTVMVKVTEFLSRIC